MKRWIASSILILTTGFPFLKTQSADQFSPIPLRNYLEFARKSADWTWQNQDSLEKDWRQKLDPESIWGYRPPGRLLEMATIYAVLFDLERDPNYAERAQKILLTYGDFRQYYPEEVAKLRPEYESGVPALPDFFTTMRFVKSFAILKEHHFFSPAEQKEIEAVISHSIEFTLRTQEWGPMNRTALRAEALAWANRALPDHPRSKIWKSYERALGFDNWGNWEIEDASLYHAVWLYAMLGYADAKKRMNELFQTPEMYYYAQYFLHLMSPDDMIPDFGDAHWRSNWDRFLVFFEAAAKAYNDPELKWAATVIARKFVDFENIQNTGLAYLLLDAYCWGTDELIPRCPDELSEEVVEDVQGKKIVFRNGWEPETTYLLLNYRDEGDGGLIFRDYLRDAIPVEEEKMTHGHADENSIVLLMRSGSVLLHDGGYRDYMPSGPYGTYRQDYFHNRLCVRPEKIWMGQTEGQSRYSVENHQAVPGQSVLDFLHNAGSYRRVRTFKIDFLTFPDFDYSRTRLQDVQMGYEWDRIIVYLKDPAMFVVFDLLKALEEEYFTACNLWHTRKIIAKGEHWYDTQYDSLNYLGLHTDHRLFIYFPLTHFKIEQVEPEKRHYQDEWVISQTAAQHFELGQQVGFITVLIPHAQDENPEEWLDQIQIVESEPLNTGLSLKIQTDDGVIQLGIKSDLRMDMIRDHRRPRYTYESGRISFGDFESNGDFFFTILEEDSLKFTVVNVSKAVYKDTVLYELAPSRYGLAFDGSPDAPGVGKARYWRDEIILK